MSVIIEAPLPLKLEKNQSRLSAIDGQSLRFERQSVRFGTKIKTLRLDSPTTIQACKELGILIDDLKSKTIEDFKDSGVDSDIVQIRFQHYFRRYNEIVKEVITKKRELVKQKSQMDQQMQIKIDSTLLEPSPTKAGSATSRPVGTNNGPSPYLLKNSFSSSKLLPPTIRETYNKTISYLKNSHSTAEVRNISDIVGTDSTLYELDKSTEEFDSVLASEVSRFNRIKTQKQKEALEIFEEDIKRIKLAQELEEREKKLREREKNMKKEHKKLEEEKKAKLAERLEQIRETDRLYTQKKIKQKGQITERLENNKIKYFEEVQARRKLATENEERILQKRRFAEERRERLKQEEQARSDRLRTEIEHKLNESQEKHNMTIHVKATRARSQILKTEEGTRRIHTQQSEDDDVHFQRVMQKLVKKEENIKAFHKKHLTELKKKELENQEKNERLVNHKLEIKENYKERVTEINERFKKVQANIELKKREDEKNMKIKQEMARLKQLDIQNSIHRKERQAQFERQKILEKERNDQEKIFWLKQQKDIIQKAKLETTLQSKIEKERIAVSIQKLGKITQGTKSCIQLNEQQIKILKEVLKPDDFKKIQEEEINRQKKLQASIEPNDDLHGTTLSESKKLRV